ncbi:MAG: bifunctional (p)ppGpp synthetase/guanosine-3',5'-bis(diphosphate) 3'-pyrophosphohydrolase [Spirochaetota bacterium]|nr:MAG: bifunctional (p)ppGpp synthetase/guanosine-3',5'-bis(diphosphate) 3'-pyrophosphohydrolase [Spirochaetota bacterium]
MQKTDPDIKEFIDLESDRIHNDKLIRRAYSFAQQAHSDQLRLSGEPYIVHPLNVAKILFDMGFDEKVIVAGLLHDTVEDTGITLTNLQSRFGKEVSELVDGVTNISRIKSENIKQHQAENIRKMLFSMVKDIRVILIKLADKLHNMRTIEYLENKKAGRIARETLDIYAPLAGRLGMAKIKFELEDLALKQLEPEFYNDLKKNIIQRKEKRERYIENVKKILYREFTGYSIDAQIVGRVKHFYSIYQKMKEKDKSFDEIFDLYAIRILTHSVKECYEVLGVVHKLWKPVRGRFKDYIAMPKSNMYQSLHTTVVGPEGKTIEVQIRTDHMNMIAEEGIAAHWAYKVGKRGPQGIEKELTWLKKLKNWKESLDNPSRFMEDLKKDLLEDEIYVFTPKGDVIQLPLGSTPIDFAYKIHTEVGNRCIGAKVNGKIVPLRKSLHSCEVVDILTSKNGSPSREWLDVVKTSRARHKIRAYFASRSDKREVTKAVEAQKGEVKRSEKKEKTEKQAIKPSAEFNLIAEGERNVQIRLAQCCTPHPGDDIIGYITRGKGITVHRDQCRNLKALKDYPKRRIAVEWAEKTKKVYSIDILSKDRPGLLMDISSAIASSNANIIEMHLKSNHNGLVKGAFRIQVKDEQQLRLLIKDMRSLPEIKSLDCK